MEGWSEWERIPCQNTNTHAFNSLVFAEIRVRNTKGFLSGSIAKKKQTCKECEDEVNQKGYLK